MREAFGVDDRTYPHYLLDAEGVAPTALHAWGSQLRGCPCGCRDHGLSPTRLRGKGLFGLLVSSASEAISDQPVRHVHPSEALALNGMDCTIDFGLNVRLSLSGVGQIASPLQAAWVLSFVTSRITMLHKGSIDFDSVSQLQAFRSWLVMKCQETWPCTRDVIQDRQMLDLVRFWKDVRSLSLEQVVHAPQWPEVSDVRMSVASALDVLIRRTQVSIPTVSIEEPETPWFESPVYGEFCDLTLRVGSNEVQLSDKSGDFLRFRFRSGATIAEVLGAHAKLTGELNVKLANDALGSVLSLDHVITPGQCIQIFLSGFEQGSFFPHELLTIEDTHVPALLSTPGEAHVVEPLDFPMPDALGPIDARPDNGSAETCQISPTLTWEAKAEECTAPLETVVGVPSTLPYTPTGGLVAALLPLSEKQFLRLAVPIIDDVQKFTALRQQFIRSVDRIALLDVQGNIWSDDEIAYHLAMLTSTASVGGPYCNVVILDPLLATAWIEDRAFPIGTWAGEHPKVLSGGVQVIGVCRVLTHWVPFHFVPCNDHVNVFTWDAPQNDHSCLNVILEKIGKNLGFASVMVSRQQRLVPISDRCGALAINFLHSALFQSQLVTSADEAEALHMQLRHKFASLLSKTEFVIRPWIWGAGDVEHADSDEGEFSHDGHDQVGSAGSMEAGPVFQGVSGRVYDVFSPQSDPSIEEGACSSEVSECASELGVRSHAGANHDIGLPRSRSRSPPFRSMPGVGPSGASAAVPAPDADGPEGESGPLPIMPDEPVRLPRYVEYPAMVNQEVAPVLFAVDHAVDNNPRSVRGLFDLGAYSRELWVRIEWDVDDLLAMSSQQMLAFQCPSIENPTRLWSMRNQVMHLRDRLTLLRHQQGVVADDEIRCHLHSIAAECESGVDFPPKRVVILDPIVSHAWLDADSFDCTEWAATHPEILQDGLQIVGAFCVDQHWIPILMTPWGDNIRIASFDTTSDLAQSLAACLTRVAHALGFTEIHFDHIHRTFAVKSVCGAVAINFLRSQVTGCPRLGTNFAAWEEHHFLRRKFMQHIGRKAEVPRPWLWGAGSRDEVEGPIHESRSGVPHDSEGQVVILTGVSGVCVDATHLCGMLGHQLQAMECPPVSDIHQMSNLRQQLIESRSRQQILRAQYGLWADDEIRFHLHAIAAVCQTLQHGSDDFPGLCA